ncbi:MAG: methionyl-tRNA formyltransferase [Duodenibacillus sp.]|nr:methionyl-tRNA formyltransferase [Duodenibacillus sp.]
MRIAFAGTPPFAATALQALISAGHEITLVLTQPDRPSGRGLKLKASPVKEVALAHGIPVLSPLTLSVKKSPEEAQTALAALEATESDVLIVAAYGLILPMRALEAAKGIGVNKDIKSINLHASILPRWRGAAPIQRAIQSGDAETGVTLMKMELGLDTGPMIELVTTPITEDDTAETLTTRLSQLGADAIVDALTRADRLTYTAQPEEGVVYAEKILKSESPVNWNASADEVCRCIRAFNPFPSATAQRNGETFKIWFARVCDGKGAPGEVLCSKKKLVIACGDKAIECTRLQKAGKPAMDVGPFLQSFPISEGEILA